MRLLSENCGLRREHLELGDSREDAKTQFKKGKKSLVRPYSVRTQIEVMNFDCKKERTATATRIRYYSRVTHILSCKSERSPDPTESGTETQEGT